MFTNKDVSARFGISRETARLWSDHFREFLSPSATPEKGKQRNYTDDDLEVFALVDSMRRVGAAEDDIKAALAAGQRGQIPRSNITPRTENTIEALKRQVSNLIIELESTQIALQRTEGKVELLEKQAEEHKTEIRQLYREIAILEASKDS